MTIGIVLVACFAATIAGGLTATMMSINKNPAEAGSVHLRLNCMWRNIQHLRRPH
jgi:hypothetical protein